MNQETLNIAMKEAVKVGLFPKMISMELYTETWEGMRSVLEVVEQNNPDVTQRDELLEALEEVASWADTLYDFQDDDDTKDLFLTIGTIRKAGKLIKELKP